MVPDDMAYAVRPGGSGNPYAGRFAQQSWRTSTSPSSGAAEMSHTGSSRPSTQSPTGSAPPASTGSPRSTTPRHAPSTTPSPIGNRLSYTGAELGRTIPRGPADDEGRLRPIRCVTPRLAHTTGPPSATPSRSTTREPSNTPRRFLPRMDRGIPIEASIHRPAVAASSRSFGIESKHW
jgi:hypothetical protein